MAAKRAETWFTQELGRRSKLKGRLTTNITTGYNVKWRVYDAVRELVQNLQDGVAVAYGFPNQPLVLDCINCKTATTMHSRAKESAVSRGWADTGPFRRGWDMFVTEPGSDEAYVGSVVWCGDSLFLHQEKCVLSKRHLMLESDKNGLSGGFGEGFKVGILVLLKEGAEVTYRMHEQEWRFGLVEAEDSTHKTFFVDSVEPKDEQVDRLDSLHVRVLLPEAWRTSSSCVPKDIMDYLEKAFIVLDRESFTEVLPIDLVRTLMVSEQRAGRIYVHGVLVTTSPVFAGFRLAINLSSEKNVINRDRDNLNNLAHTEMIVMRAALRGPPQCRDRMLDEILRCCVAEGSKLEADAHVTNRLRGIRGVATLIEKALEERHRTDNVYLASSNLSCAQRNIAEKLGYMLVPSGWLASSIPHKNMLTMQIENSVVSNQDISNLSRRSQVHLQQIRAVFDTFAHVVEKEPIEILVWAPPRELHSSYECIHLDNGKAYVPKSILNLSRNLILPGVVLAAVKEAYSPRCSMSVVEYFRKTGATDVPSGGRLEGFIAMQRQTTVDDGLLADVDDSDSDCDSGVEVTKTVVAAAPKRKLPDGISGDEHAEHRGRRRLLLETHVDIIAAKLDKTFATAETQVDDGDIDGSAEVDPEDVVRNEILPRTMSGCEDTYATIVSRYALWAPPSKKNDGAMAPCVITLIGGTEVIVDSNQQPIRIDEVTRSVADAARFVNIFESTVGKGVVRLCFFNGNGAEELLTLNDGAHVLLNVRNQLSSSPLPTWFAVCDELASFAAPRRGQLRSKLCVALIGRFSAKTNCLDHIDGEPDRDRV